MPNHPTQGTGDDVDIDGIGTLPSAVSLKRQPPHHRQQQQYQDPAYSASAYGSSAASGAATEDDASGIMSSAGSYSTQPTASSSSGAEPGLLVCEFRDLMGCGEVFDAGETDAWIRHISREHLLDRFPGQSLCWFCDSAEFQAGSREERRSVFKTRLRHVRAHIVYEGWSYEDMRPDFHVLRHMHRHKLLSQECFDHAMAYTEVPEPLRLQDAVPPNWERPEVVRERKRSGRQVFDQQKEDRLRMREERKRKPKK